MKKRTRRQRRREADERERTALGDEIKAKYDAMVLDVERCGKAFCPGKASWIPQPFATLWHELIDLVGTGCVTQYLQGLRVRDRWPDRSLTEVRLLSQRVALIYGAWLRARAA